MTRSGDRRRSVSVDPVGTGACAGLVVGWTTGAALGLTLDSPDIAWPVAVLLLVTLAGLVVGLTLGLIVDFRRQNASRPQPHDRLGRRPGS